MTDGWIEYPAAITATFNDVCDHAQVIAPERTPPGGGYAPTRPEAQEAPHREAARAARRPAHRDVLRRAEQRDDPPADPLLHPEDARVLEEAADLRAAAALYVAWYNWCRPHGALRGATPAMALGLEETFWPLERLLP